MWRAKAGYQRCRDRPLVQTFGRYASQSPGAIWVIPVSRNSALAIVVTAADAGPRQYRIHGRRLALYALPG